MTFDLPSSHSVSFISLQPVETWSLLMLRDVALVCNSFQITYNLPTVTFCVFFVSLVTFLVPLVDFQYQLQNELNGLWMHHHNKRTAVVTAQSCIMEEWWCGSDKETQPIRSTRVFYRCILIHDAKMNGDKWLEVRKIIILQWCKQHLENEP